MSLIKALFLTVAFLSMATLSAEAADRPCKILVVMSYHDEFVWQSETRKGIQDVLSKSCELKYFNLDVKRNPQDGPKRAKEAYERYLFFRPSAVIAADDAAQSLFVVPFLKNQARTPVVFCGVNADPAAYGYPASNVTGVIERYHNVQTIAFLKKLVPGIRSIAIIMGGSNPEEFFDRWTKQDIKAIPLRLSDIVQPKTMEDAVEEAKKLSKRSDAIFLEHFESLKDRHGKLHSHKEIVLKLLSVINNKPTACANDYTVKAGCLCSVIKTGYEQGAIAAKMVLKILQGTPISRVPITRNYEGIKMLNVTTMNNLGINPPPEILRDVKLVKTEP